MVQRVERVYSPSRVSQQGNMPNVKLLQQSWDCLEPDAHASVDSHWCRASESRSSLCSAGVVLSRKLLSDVPIDTYHPHAAVSCQLVIVQSGPSCAKHWPDKQDGWEADVVKIRGRRICDLKLRMACSFWKP